MQLASSSTPRTLHNSGLVAQDVLRKRLDFVLAVSLFLASFILYLRTLAPSLLYGDSAEFQTIAYTLGIGHPTGYPVYVLLAKLFTLIPVGEIAYRVNLFSAFSAALTIALVYLTTRQLGAMIPAAIYGSLTLALVPLFWKHASIAEIYAPSAACFALILFAVNQWKRSSHPRWLFLAGLLGGLSLGIQSIVALSGIAVLLYLILSNINRSAAFQALFGTGIGLILFFSSFLLLDLLDSPAGYYNTVVRPSLSVWGMTPGDFDSPIERLAFLYFPPQFRGQFLNVSSDEALTRLVGFVRDASWSLWLALLGLGSLVTPRRAWASRWPEALFLLFIFGMFLAFAATYNVYDYQVYYLPAIVVLTSFIGLGVSAIAEIVASIPRMPSFLPVGLSVLILTLGFYPSVAEVSFHWQERIPPGLEDWEGYFFSFPDHRKFEAEQTVNKLEDHAIVFTDWDQAYSFYYVAHVLQGRTGMSFHETYPQEGVSRFADSAIVYIEANIDIRPIYFSARPSFLATRYKITRAGSGLFQIEKK